MNIVVIDYGVGNVKSIINALKFNGVNALLSNKEKDIINASGIILPGVGAYSKAMENLNKLNLVDIITKYSKTNRPILGICLGMQMLMESSEEFGITKGLGLIKGNVKKFTFDASPRMKLPHISWSNLEPDVLNWNNTILDGLNSENNFYFVHSYVVIPTNKQEILSLSSYCNQIFCSAIKKDNIYGCQFHPEKSASSGLKIINNFVDICNKI